MWIAVAVLLKQYFEIRGLREGRAKLTTNARLAHDGTRIGLRKRANTLHWCYAMDSGFVA